MKTKPRLPASIQKAMKRYPAFTQKVWRACFQIPRGEVRTYQWIASKIRKPKACRAVGNALKMNPFSPIVPCHRVIRSDGGLGGFSAPGGIRQKIRLLKREGAL